MTPAIDYLNPDIPANLRIVPMPIVDATPENLEGFGRLVTQPEKYPIEITQWPATGWRPVDTGTGDHGGTTEGLSVSEWKGDVLYSRNEAVGGHYILAYAELPEQAVEDHQRPPKRMLLWHANYHPDGGQLFFPQQKETFLVPLALPGDDIMPDKFICFRFDGSMGLYIHPNVWHEGAFPLSGKQKFLDKQGKVHASVSVDFAREFSCLLSADIA